MIEFFSMKTFIIAYIWFLVFFAMYVYCGDGSQEHEEKVLIIGVFGALHVYLFLFLMTMKPEIKAFMAQLKSVENVSAENKVSEKKTYYTSQYVEGYLQEDARWLDLSGNVHSNSEETKVEIWKSKVVAMDGNELTQIYFLEGIYIGQWGYTVDEFLLEDD